jgi:ABC-type branched-subunit amino acid transport system substrate-binding protein
MGAVAALAIAVTLLSACSSSSKTSDATSSAAGGGAASSGASSGGPATGTPILIGNWVALSAQGFQAPQEKSGVEAAIASINAAGGVKGHPLKLDFCDQKFDPNQEIACARQMVSDKVAAVVAPSVFFGTGSIPILQAAGIPEIASQGLTPSAEYNCKTCYPLGGAYGWFWGADDALLKAGATKIAIIGVNVAASATSSTVAADGLKAAGITPVRTVNADPAATDLSSVATQAMAGGVDGIVLTTSPQIGPKAIAALKAAGYTGKIATITDVINQAAVTALGDTANGLLLTSLVAFANDTSNKGVAQFNADMKQYSPSATVDTLALEGWGGVELFATVASQASVTAYDAASINTAMQNLDLSAAQAPIYGGYVIKGVTSAIPSLPGLLHTTVQNGSVVSGTITAQGPLVDVMKDLPAYKASH